MNTNKRLTRAAAKNQKKKLDEKNKINDSNDKQRGETDDDICQDDSIPLAITVMQASMKGKTQEPMQLPNCKVAADVNVEIVVDTSSQGNHFQQLAHVGSSPFPNGYDTWANELADEMSSVGGTCGSVQMADELESLDGSDDSNLLMANVNDAEVSSHEYISEILNTTNNHGAVPNTMTAMEHVTPQNANEVLQDNPFNELQITRDRGTADHTMMTVEGDATGIQQTNSTSSCILVENMDTELPGCGLGLEPPKQIHDSLMEEIRLLKDLVQEKDNRLSAQQDLLDNLKITLEERERELSTKSEVTSTLQRDLLETRRSLMKSETDFAVARASWSMSRKPKPDGLEGGNAGVKPHVDDATIASGSGKIEVQKEPLLRQHAQSLTEYADEKEQDKGKVKAADTAKTQQCNASNLGKHSIHPPAKNGPKLHKCVPCNKVFFTSGSLNKHQMKHNLRTCRICGRTFPTLASLLRHRRKHPKSKFFVCGLCGSSFRSYDGFRQHQMMHTGIYRFSCVFCGVGFSKISNFEDHVTAHTGERPYSCFACHASFSYRQSLRRHLKLHE